MFDRKTFKEIDKKSNVDFSVELQKDLKKVKKLKRPKTYPNLEYKLFIFEFERGDTSGGLAVVSAMSKEMAMKELKKEHDYETWELIETLDKIPKKTKVVAIDYLILCGDL